MGQNEREKRAGGESARGGQKKGTVVTARAQTDLFAPIWGDYFAGGAGASTGIACAVGQPAYFAVNHSRAALDMYRQNHPHTRLYCEDVFDVDPEKICEGHPMWLLWASPDCTHHSKARGGKPVSKHIRGLPWAIVRAAMRVRPGCIMFENVEEIQSWGPLLRDENGNEFPDPARKGETFQGFIAIMTTGIEAGHPAHLECCEFLGIEPESPNGRRLAGGLGYEFEGRELVAADYGAPTIRKRYYGIFRCDGKPIRWPERTHAPRDSEEVRAGKLLPWRSAAEIIDWSLPGYSVFASKEEIREKYGVNAVRPLAKNTMRRVIRGVDKFTIRSAEPFIVPTGRDSGMTPVTFSNTGGSVGLPADRPVHTITSDGKQVLAAANLIQYHSEQTEAVRAASVAEPVQTVDGSNRYGLTCANLVEYYGNGVPLDLREPMHTATGHDREAIVSAHVQKYFDGGYKGCGSDAGNPLPTVTAQDHNALAAAHVVEFKGEDIGQRATAPLRTITASPGEFAACHAVLCKADGRDLGHWPEIRALLNEYCGYAIADDEVLLIQIGGVWYYIADITLRMLTPRELYNAMGFKPDYCIDFSVDGKPYSKSDKVERCGNAVCPDVSEALVRANFPERCVAKVGSMEELERLVAV